ncbi:hypothetical protein ACQPVP_02835 [Clostridium nigeriense]|uniref:hypothetical protein n=1 Tax=Clostridium nigeriense TaxID=1805470 RepID=UPI003D334A49
MEIKNNYSGIGSILGFLMGGGIGELLFDSSGLGMVLGFLLGLVLGANIKKTN